SARPDAPGLASARSPGPPWPYARRPGHEPGPPPAAGPPSPRGHHARPYCATGRSLASPRPRPRGPRRGLPYPPTNDVFARSEPFAKLYTCQPAPVHSPCPYYRQGDTYNIKLLRYRPLALIGLVAYKWMKKRELKVEAQRLIRRGVHADETLV